MAAVLSRLVFTLLSLFIILACLSGTQVHATPSAKDIKTILSVHNAHRAKHHSPALVWDKKVASYAQNWSNNCVFKHSGGFYGENLALGQNSWTSAINDWYNEVKDYNYSKPGFSADTGHFTAVVWKSTTKIGCGAKFCSNLFNGATLYTCSYYTAGNIVSHGNTYFIKNVLKP